jgi:hypothetical protein
LYNLKTDIGEKTDLCDSQPRKAARLKKKLDAWLAETGAKMPQRLPDSQR